MTEKELTRVNYTVHESGHAIGSLSRGLDSEIEICSRVADSGHRLGATYWHYGGTPEDDVFSIYCGIETSKLFSLGEVGCLKDFHDIEDIILSVDNLDDPEAWKQEVQQNSEAFINGHTEIILKMAYALFMSTDSKLSTDETRDIWSGKTDIMVRQDFIDRLALVSQMIWRLPSHEFAGTNQI